MPNLLEQAAAWLEGQRTKHMSRTVTYQRGAHSVEVLATVGKTTFELDDGAGAVLRVESRDYLILTADLALGGSPTLPQRGDRVRETQGSQAFVHEVTGFGDEPAWRYSDPYRKALRVHTKQVDVEASP